jgi:hypothetical protein
VCGYGFGFEFEYVYKSGRGGSGEGCGKLGVVGLRSERRDYILVRVGDALLIWAAFCHPMFGRMRLGISYLAQYMKL